MSAAAALSQIAPVTSLFSGGGAGGPQTAGDSTNRSINISGVSGGSLTDILRVVSATPNGTSYNGGTTPRGPYLESSIEPERTNTYLVLAVLAVLVFVVWKLK